MGAGRRGWQGGGGGWGVELICKAPTEKVSSLSVHDCQGRENGNTGTRG